MSDEDDLLEKFTASRPFNFDLTSLMSKDLARLDNENPPPSLFKYFPGNRPHFFGQTNASIHSTHRLE